MFIRFLANWTSRFLAISGRPSCPTPVPSTLSCLHFQTDMNFARLELPSALRRGGRLKVWIDLMTQRKRLQGLHNWENMKQNHI